MWFIEVLFYDIDGRELHRRLFPHEGETEQVCQEWQTLFNQKSWELYCNGEGDGDSIRVSLRSLGSLDSEAKKKFISSLFFE